MAQTRYSIPEHVKDYAVALYLGGLTQEQVGAKIGAKGCAVLRFLRERKVPSRPFCPHNKCDTSVRDQAIRLYVDHQHTIPEVAKILGRGTSTIARWLKKVGATRPMGEAFAMATQKGRKKWGHPGSIPWQSAKTGKWEFADSKWEVVRMAQLDSDPGVRWWTHVVPRVPYTDATGKRRFYAPDFLIDRVDGCRVVEEIKPQQFLAHSSTQIKAAAAGAFYADQGVQYRIITEHGIGLRSIQAFRLEGLMSITDEQRRAALSRRKAAAMKRRSAPRVEAARAKRLERARQMAEAYASGLTLAEVAQRFGVCGHSVSNWLDKLGVSRRPAVMREHQRLLLSEKRKAYPLVRWRKTA